MNHTAVVEIYRLPCNDQLRPAFDSLGSRQALPYGLTFGKSISQLPCCRDRDDVYKIFRLKDHKEDEQSSKRKGIIKKLFSLKK
jgi:hypothetical protein